LLILVNKNKAVHHVFMLVHSALMLTIQPLILISSLISNAKINV